MKKFLAILLLIACTIFIISCSENQVSLEEASLISVSAGDSHGIALTDDGQIYTWGYNLFGQLGIGKSGRSKKPTLINLGFKVSQISAGDYFTYIISDNNDLYGCGTNRCGEMCDASLKDFDSFTRILPEKKFKRVSAGDAHVLAIDLDGKLYTWGDNKNGQLGNGKYGGHSATPIAVMNETEFVAISAGQQFSLAIDKNGNIWAWGINVDGNIGNGKHGNSYINTLKQPIPVQVTKDIKFSAVAAGKTHSMALDESGNIWTWGNNYDGQLSNPSQSLVVVPTKVNSSIKYCKIAAGDYHSLAIDNDGNLYGCGLNDDGQLCLGGIKKREFTLINDGIKYADIDGGNNFSLFVDTHKKFYAYGSNSDKKLGNDK